MPAPIDHQALTAALHQLNEQLYLQDAPVVELVVCGGSALIATGLVLRTTHDVDILAFIESQTIRDSEPLPDYLVLAARNVARNMGLAADWLNNGPASQFRLGLPEGIQERLHRVVYGERLVVHFISRYDQIFFKTFAAVDRAGYHVSDLLALKPTAAEMLAAAQWCLTQDVSEEFHAMIKIMFTQLGWPDVSQRL